MGPPFPDRRALVVDDDPFVTTAVKAALSPVGFEVEVAHNAEDAAQKFLDFDPDVAILDVELGRGPSGVDLAHIAHRAYPGTALLLLSRYPDLRTTRAAKGELPDECGFLSKQNVTDASVLVGAVEAVLRGTRPDDFERADGPLAALTRTQLTVLRMVVQGYTSAEIARRRGCSTNAVEKILTAVYERLGIRPGSAVHPRVEAVRIWAEGSALPERVDG